MSRKQGKEPAPGPSPPRRVVLSVKGSDAWKAWLVKMITFSRLPTAYVIDLALRDYAEKIGYSDQPPPR